MGLDTNDLITLARPVLNCLSPEIPYSLAGERLVIGTGLTESNLSQLFQVGGGPAVGLWQMEPATHDWLWVWLMNGTHDSLRRKVQALMAPLPSRINQLAGNLHYAIAMCRIRYYVSPEPLPCGDDWDGLASYWVRVYNAGGAGTTARFLEATACLRS